jgi:hypothetical protein
MTDRLPHVRAPDGDPDVCVHCRGEWVDLLTLYETDECSVRLRAEVERLRADLDALSRAVGQALVASSLAAGETLADPIPHIIVSTVTRLRAEALGQRAEASYLRACVPPSHPADYGHEAWSAALAAARAENENAEDARRERAAVVKYLRSLMAGYPGREHPADRIERGEHRREEAP